MTASDDNARRAFWTEQLDRAYDLMLAMHDQPYEECGEPLAPIAPAMDEAGVTVTYSQSLCGEKFERLYYLRESLLPDVAAIARDMNERGWTLHIEDAYRTYDMQSTLGVMPSVFDVIVERCAWEANTGTPPADLVFKRAMCLVANIPINGTHLYGAAIDISVFEQDTGNEVWRGAPYLEMTELTPMVSPFVDEQSQQNRRDITAILEAHGFMHYPGEFWHYNKGDMLAQMLSGSSEPAKFTPVHWKPGDTTVQPFDDITSPIRDTAAIGKEIEAAMKRFTSK